MVICSTLSRGPLELPALVLDIPPEVNRCLVIVLLGHLLGIALDALVALEDAGLGGVPNHLLSTTSLSSSPGLNSTLEQRQATLLNSSHPGAALSKLLAWLLLPVTSSTIMLFSHRCATVILFCACLVKADGAGEFQGLHALQILHKVILVGHPLSSQPAPEQSTVS